MKERIWIKRCREAEAKFKKCRKERDAYKQAYEKSQQQLKDFNDSVEKELAQYKAKLVEEGIDFKPKDEL